MSGCVFLGPYHKRSGKYTSARLKTIGRFEFQYGRVEARIRIPYGQGIWPGFWLLGNNIGEVGWPKCGEIDIMEN
jgi:beta-glucanase (GH16 family)